MQQQHKKPIKHLLNALIISTVSMMVLGCSSLSSKNPGDWVGFTEKGEASYYANLHQNKKTANGELFKQELKTAAHKTLPFGSIVKVTNVDNGKTVVVRVNDRGPFVRGRIIDLSKSAFTSIGNPAKGLLDVKIEVIR